MRDVASDELPSTLAPRDGVAPLLGLLQCYALSCMLPCVNRLRCSTRCAAVTARIMTLIASLRRVAPLLFAALPLAAAVPKAVNGYLGPVSYTHLTLPTIYSV